MIETKLFKFDSKTDYLPYYKSYKLPLNNENTINDVLDTINDIEKFGYISGEAFFLRVNGVFTSSDVTISKFISDSGELLLEPLSVNRAVNDLIIDTKDYQEKLSLLDSYFTAEEKALIIKEKIYMLEYYASNTLHFENDYIGEHVLFLASELIQKDPSLKDEISSLVDTDNGIKIRSSLNYRVVDSKEGIPKHYAKVTLDSDIVQYFDNFNIALYCGLNDAYFETIIKNSNATYIELQSKHFDIPMSSTKLSNIMAGTVLLEAMDNNADFLIVNDTQELKHFDEQQKSIEKVMGREIGLPVLTRDEFTQLLQGTKSLSSHKIKIPFLD